MSRAASTTSGGRQPVELPDDLPGENDVVRALFHACDGEALEVIVEDTVVYLLPWAARDGGVAAFEQDVETFDARPVEFTGREVRRLLEAHIPREVSLASTPAWVLAPDVDGPAVSWHARCRWAERVEPMTDPAPAVREAWRTGFQVGVPRGYGRYDPVAGAVVCYVGATYDDPLVVTTVLAVDDVEQADEVAADHLRECDLCSGLWDPTDADRCAWCGARPATSRPALPVGA